MNELVAIPPHLINEVWPSIRDQSLQIERPDGFLPEDAFMMCKTNGASLFLLKTDGKQIGFMIARLQLPDLHIWQLYAETGYDVLEAFRPQLMELARGANASKITYGSARRAWSNVASKHKFKMRLVVYECDVEAPPPPQNAMVDATQNTNEPPALH